MLTNLLDTLATAYALAPLHFLVITSIMLAYHALAAYLLVRLARLTYRGVRYLRNSRKAYKREQYFAGKR